MSSILFSRGTLLISVSSSESSFSCIEKIFSGSSHSGHHMNCIPSIDSPSCILPSNIESEIRRSLNSSTGIESLSPRSYLNTNPFSVCSQLSSIYSVWIEVSNEGSSKFTIAGWDSSRCLTAVSNRTNSLLSPLYSSRSEVWASKLGVECFSSSICIFIDSISNC